MALGYFCAARLSYRLAIPQGVVTMWMPSGLMLGMLLASPRRDWAVLAVGGLVGCFASDLLSHSPVGTAVAAAVMNILESLVAATFICRADRTTVRLDTASRVGEFVLGAVVAMNALTSLGGALVLGVGHAISWPRAWFHWWVGDGLGMLLVAPVVLAMATRPRSRSLPPKRRVAEAVILAALLAWVGSIAFAPALHSGASVGIGPYVIFPLLFWAGVRFGPEGAALASFITAAQATWYSAIGVGPFSGNSLTGSNVAAHAYLFLLIASVSSLVAAALVEERTSAAIAREAAAAELREAEARTRFALETSHVGVWEVDHATGAMLWSDVMESMHGLSAGEFAGTRDAFIALVHPEDREAVARAMVTAERQQLDSNFTYRCLWPDGTTHAISMRGRAARDASGAIRSSTGIAMDVTVVRDLEEQYRQAQKMEAVGQLAGGIAHDFNNVLTAIEGYTAILAEDLPPGTQQQADLREIASATARATGLTRQLLAFSRRQILAPRVLDLGRVVRGMESMLRRLIPEDVTINVRCEPGLRPVRADAGQMEQVVLNLALNARDAMPGGGTLSIEVMNVLLSATDELRHVDAISGDCVLLAVTDSGTGMDAATRLRVFEPFFTTKPADRGTGLGLSTVHGIVNQSGGRVWIYSEPGRGSTFKVYLPCVDAPLDVIPSVGEPPMASGSETILLVEDDAALRSLAHRVLSSRGFNVLEASSPGEAIALASRGDANIALLLTDIVMPEMNGRALAETLLKTLPELKVLFMSGYTNDEVIRRGVLAHEMQFIQKPFSPLTLLTRVRQMLGDS